MKNLPLCDLSAYSGRRRNLSAVWTGFCQRGLIQILNFETAGSLEIQILKISAIVWTNLFHRIYVWKDLL